MLQEILFIVLSLLIICFMKDIITVIIVLCIIAFILYYMFAPAKKNDNVNNEL